MDDLEAEGLRAAVRRRLFGETDHEPLRVGRYVLHEPLGRGGMGIVHAAYDPDLERRVALKLVRPSAGLDASDETRARRLVREAQSIARLSHPNVITVHEVGRWDGGVFIAMELVEGLTVRRWCKERSPARAQILSVFIDAGRGLVAAHTTGLIHRDFKPDNVMVDLDESGQPARVRVLDFGLARLHASPDSETSMESSPAPAEPEDAAMTETGTVLGTPIYMAPEQRAGSVGPHSDQFSYCMALAEALLGQRPARPQPDLDVVLGLEAKDLPTRLRQALTRGLRADPTTRWPSMAHLLTELETLAGRSRRRSARLTLGLGGIVFGTVAAALALADSEPPCEDGSSRSPTLWSSLRKEKVEAAFSQSAVPYAEQAWVTVQHTLDETVSDWSSAVDRHCGVSREPIDQWWSRDACLDQQASEIDALITLLQSGEPGVIEHAAQAVDALPSAQRCEAGPPPVPPPKDPQLALHVQRLRVELAGLSATAAAGRHATAVSQALSVQERAETLGYGPLVAEATLMLARMHAGSGDAAEAERVLYTAIERAEAERHDDVTAQAWLTLLEVVVGDLARIDDADRLLAPATGAIRRLGDDGHLLPRAWIVQGALRHEQGRFDEAIELHERALARLEADFGSQHLRLAQPLRGIAKAEQGRGDVQASLAPAQRALELVRTHLGPQHPDVATYLSAVANAQVMLGRPELAVPQFQRAVEVLELALGPWHPRLAAALHNLGANYAALRRFDEALPVLRRALAIDTRAHGATHPHAAASHYAVAMVLQQRGDLEQAETELREGLAGLERAWGPEHPDLAYLVVALGHLQLSQGNADASLPLFERGDRLLRKALGDQHPRRVHGLYGQARAHLALEDSATARVELQHALAIADAATLPPLDRAELWFTLAQILPPDATAEARELAQRSERAYRDAGSVYEVKRQEVEQWLATGAEHAP